MNYRLGLAAMKPYSMTECRMPVKLDANEKPSGLPVAVAQAIGERLANLEFNRYPEIGAASLRKKLAASLGVSPEQIQIGNGSSELLASICHAFGGAGRKIVYPNPSFSMYPVYAKLADSDPTPVKLLSDYTLPLNAFISAAEQADLAIICNPNNPTGNAIPLEIIMKLASSLTCPLVVDEAYFEFYKTSAISLIKQYPNLIVVRTFSKAYGLAAARVGYLIASAEVSAMVGKVLLPYHVSSLALAAAETVFDLKDEFAPDIEAVIQERKRLAAALSSTPGVLVYPSETNFLLVKSPYASKLVARLAKSGIGVRDFSQNYGLEGCLRVTVGTEAENNAVINIFSTEAN